MPLYPSRGPARIPPDHAPPSLSPRDNGTLVYLNGGEDLNLALGRVKEAGGEVVMDKTDIGQDIGHFALFIDSEGNRVGLYSKY